MQPDRTINDEMELDLLRQVVAEPDDLAPRLVCADWYDEQGDPRGEFIRLQLQLARRDLNDTDRAVLRNREAELLHENVRRWNAPLHRLLYRGGLKDRVGSRRKAIRGWSYRRGFVEELSVDARTYARYALLLSELGPIHRLHLFDVSQRDAIEEVANCPSLRSVRSLAFRDAGLHVGHLHRLAGSPHIERLAEIDIRGTRLWRTSAEAAFRGRSVRILANAEPPPYVPPVWQPPVTPPIAPRTPVRTVRRPPNTAADNLIVGLLVAGGMGLGVLLAALDDDKAGPYRTVPKYEPPRFKPPKIDATEFWERERKLAELQELVEKLRDPKEFPPEAERRAAYLEGYSRFEQLPGVRMKLDPSRFAETSEEAMHPDDVPPPPPAPPTRDTGPSSNR